jgi:polyferredoxin
MRKPLANLHWTAQATLTFLFKHLLAGVLGGFFFGALFLYYDVSKLWTMISASSDGWLVVIMLFTGLGVTFGSIGMGWGIFSLAQERDDPPEDHTYY